MVSIGDQAPAFNLINHKREAVSLEQHKGKKVVLVFFPAAFTGVCEKELCSFRDSIDELAKVDAVVLAIAVDAPFANAAFAEKTKISFPILSDYARSAVTAYGVEHPDFAGLPGYVAAKRSVFVVDREGVIRYTWIAPNPGVEPDYDEVKKAVSALS